MIWDQDQEMPLGFPKVLKLPLVLRDPAICPRVRVMRILQYLSTCASVTQTILLEHVTDLKG